MQRNTNLPQWLNAFGALCFAPQPGCGFNVDANVGHAFGIFMVYVGTLRNSCSGAG